MAVKMLTGMAGDTWAVSPGEKYESDAAHEARLIEKGLAEPWPEDPAPAAKPKPKAGK
jgi:hypothetical protein